MIETLVETESHILMTDLSFTDIDFGADHSGIKRMDRPLYGSLIDYGRAPSGVQFEPSFQIRAKQGEEIRIEFQIQQDVPIELMPNDENGVACHSVDHPGLLPKGLVANELINAKHCRLTWNQSSEDESRKLTVLRLLCVRNDGMDLTNAEKVEGGLYLAIVNREQGFTPGTPELKDPGPPSDSTIKIHGIDGVGRPVYDLFSLDPEEVPAHLELEPAFRVREGAQVNFKLVLDLPEPYQNVVFFPDIHGHVDVRGHSPESRPSQLQRSNFFEGDPQACRLRWVQETGRSGCTAIPGEGKECYCTHGYASSFHLRSNQWPSSLERFKTLLEAGDIETIYAEIGAPVTDFDPTVIQPPVCTSVNGQTVCTE